MGFLGRTLRLWQCELKFLKWARGQIIQVLVVPAILEVPRGMGLLVW